MNVKWFYPTVRYKRDECEIVLFSSVFNSTLNPYVSIPLLTTTLLTKLIEWNETTRIGDFRCASVRNYEKHVHSGYAMRLLANYLLCEYVSLSFLWWFQPSFHVPLQPFNRVTKVLCNGLSPKWMQTTRVNSGSSLLIDIETQTNTIINSKYLIDTYDKPIHAIEKLKAVIPSYAIIIHFGTVQYI